jgi:hypothetical protein
MKNRELAERLAARAVLGYFQKFGSSHLHVGSPSESAETARLVRTYLREVDTWCPDDKIQLYYDLVEGTRDPASFEERHGTLAFEVLVQLALSYGAYRLDRRVLRIVRSHASAIHTIGSLEAIYLAQEVTAACRERYAPQMLAPRDVPEKAARALRPSEAGDVALRCLEHWFASVGTAEVGRVIFAGHGATPLDKKLLFHDVCEGVNLDEPIGKRSRKETRAAYRRNRATALAALAHDFRRDGLGVEDVVREHAWELSQRIGVCFDHAFGFLRHLATHRRPE